MCKCTSNSKPIGDGVDVIKSSWIKRFALGVGYWFEENFFRIFDITAILTVFAALATIIIQMIRLLKL